MERLFDLEVVSGSFEGASNFAKGCAVEHLVIAELLARGHRVAKPVVDDDGVDLIVDYRWKVQVKASSVEVGPARQLCFHTRSRLSRARIADVFVFFDLRESRSAESRFFVVPESALSRGDVLQLGHRYTRFRGAWDVFDGLGLEQAA